MPEPKHPSPQGIRIQVVVAGRVQGVGFRYATVDAANRIGLRGWVRNMRDGRVEIVAEGSREQVRELVDWCRRGPALARVTAVDWFEVTADETLDGFEVRSTG
jgi:acylphosphatase